MIQIVPAILATNETDLQMDIDKIKNSSTLEESWVHIDFMDNKFVPNESIRPELLTKYTLNNSKEAHLMVDAPNVWVSDLTKANFKRAIAHIEVSDDELEDFIAGCKVSDLELGISIKMDTPTEKLLQYLEIVDMVLVMSVDPGFQGRPFLENSIERIKELANIRRDKNLDFIISVDGAVSEKNAKTLVDAGVDQLTIGSYLMKAENIDENVEKLWEVINS